MLFKRMATISTNEPQPSRGFPVRNEQKMSQDGKGDMRKPMNRGENKWPTAMNGDWSDGVGNRGKKDQSHTYNPK